MRLKVIKLSEIKGSIYQPRHQEDLRIEGLVKSILNSGLLTAITVREEKKGYKIIYGNRRCQALKIILETAHQKIPDGGAKVVEDDIEIKAIVLDELKDIDAAFNAFNENANREDLTPLDRGLFYLDMTKMFKLTQAQIAERVGLSEDYIRRVTNRLKHLPELILKAWKDYLISAEHVEVITALKTEEKQLRLLKKVLDRRLSVIETEMEALRMRDKDDIPTKERKFYFIEERFYENEEFIEYIREDRVRLRTSHKGRWISFNLHSPRDFKTMLQLVIDLLPEHVLKKIESA